MLEAVATARRAPTTCECGAPVPWGSHFCANCGRPVGAEPVVACEGCGHPLPADASFCAQLRPAGRDQRRGRAREPELPKPPEHAGRRDDPALGRSAGSARWPQPEDERRCPRCGTPYAEGQEYCLECGERLPARAEPATRLGDRWRRHLGWYPGDWIWPALLALVVAVVAGVALGDLARRRLELGQRHDRPHPGRPSTERPRPQTAPEPTITAARRRPRRPARRRGASAASPKPALVSWPAGEERLDDRARLGADRERPRRSGRARPSRRCGWA